MTDLTDALDRYEDIRFQMLLSAADLLDALDTLEAAARRVETADDIWWCDTHDAHGLHFCWRAAGMPLAIGDDPKARCHMVRRLLLKPDAADT